jgi:hypothetical protein
MEVVIDPLPEKLKAVGVKLEQLQDLRHRRLSSGDWRTEIGGKQIDLAKVARLTVRKIHAPPFTVMLPDGRQAVITPNPERIADYLVTGQDFEDSVRKALADPFVVEPGKVRVLSGIRVPGGHIPNYWGRDHVHISLGEALNRFAKVKFRGRKGPQAADLERMRKLRRLLDKATAEEANTPRERFEKVFGTPKESEDPETAGWLYPVGAGHLQVFYDGSPENSRHVLYWSGPEPPQSRPRDYGKEARAVYRMDRAFLLAFLHKKFGRATAAEKAKLRAYLNKTNPVVHWTPDERERLLNGPRNRRK